MWEPLRAVHFDSVFVRLTGLGDVHFLPCVPTFRTLGDPLPNRPGVMA